MNLVDICEPIFREICDFNRVVAIRPQDYDLRATLLARLQEAETKSGVDPLLGSQFEQIKKPLVYFIDDYVVSSPLFRGEGNGGAPHPLIASWQTQLLENELFGNIVGGHLFYAAVEARDGFDGLDETLKDHRPDAKERLLIFRTCLGLGFGGLHRDEPAKISDYLTKIRQRLGRLGYAESEDPNAEICPEAANPKNRPVPTRPARWLRRVAEAFVILTVGVLVFYFFQFSEGKRELTNLLDQIINAEAGR